MRKISADGWRTYLRPVNKSDARALFAYLAREEGRKPGGVAPTDSMTQLSEGGRLV